MSRPAGCPPARRRGRAIDHRRRCRTGQRLQPRHAASLWSTYHWRAWEFGAGVRHLGSSSDESGALHIPAVTLFDLMLAYDARSWRFALNASNVEDEVYVTSCLERGDCFYGTRGVVVGRLTFRF